MVFTAFRAIEGTRGENPLIYMIFRRYRYHSAIIISRIQPDIAVERNSRQAKAENSTENRILHWFLKGIFIFAQWFWGPQLVLYKWLWSKLSNYSMIFRPKMHDFGTYLTIVHFTFQAVLALICIILTIYMSKKCYNRPHQIQFTKSWNHVWYFFLTEFNKM